VHVQIDPTLKHRAIVHAAKAGVSFHNVLEAALRRYLSSRGSR
jgi:hypothetical protein